MNNSGGIAGDILRSFIERIERLEIEKKALAEDIKEVYAEAKSSGFEVKIIRKVVALRQMESHERQELEALLDIYFHAVEGAVPKYEMIPGVASYEDHVKVGWTDKMLIDAYLMKVVS